MSNTENKNDLEQDTNSVSEFVNDNTDKTKSGIDNTTDKTQSGVNNTTDKIQSGIDKQSENVSSGVDKLNSSFQDIAGELFTTNNLLILIGFLGVYFGYSYFIKGNAPEVNVGSYTQRGTSVVIDIFFFIIICIILYLLFTDMNNTDKKKTMIGSFVNELTDYLDNPSSVLISLFLLIGLYMVIYLFGIPMEAGVKPIAISIIETIAWSLLVIIIIIDFFKYVFNVSFKELFDKIKAFFNGEEEKEEEVSELPPVKCETPSTSTSDPDSEVFNVSNNLYTYEDAKAICKAYDSTLATYEQVESAYNSGAEWCNYGWSDGQMALFPTQKNTWDNLQKLDEGQCDANKKKGNNCGRPGINGGYIANPYVKFGVNCFGKKPKPTENDLKVMDAKKESVYPKTPEELELEKKIDYWKDNADKYLQLNSYNTTKWNKKNSSTKNSN